MVFSRRVIAPSLPIWTVIRRLSSVDSFPSALIHALLPRPDGVPGQRRLDAPRPRGARGPGTRDGGAVRESLVRSRPGRGRDARAGGGTGPGGGAAARGPGRA